MRLRELVANSLPQMRRRRKKTTHMSTQASHPEDFVASNHVQDAQPFARFRNSRDTSPAISEASWRGNLLYRDVQPPSQSPPPPYRYAHHHVDRRLFHQHHQHHPDNYSDICSSNWCPPPPYHEAIPFETPIMTQSFDASMTSSEMPRCGCHTMPCDLAGESRHRQIYPLAELNQEPNLHPSQQHERHSHIKESRSVSSSKSDHSFFQKSLNRFKNLRKHSKSKHSDQNEMLKSDQHLAQSQSLTIDNSYCERRPSKSKRKGFRGFSRRSKDKSNRHEPSGKTDKYWFSDNDTWSMDQRSEPDIIHHHLAISRRPNFRECSVESCSSRPVGSRESSCVREIDTNNFDSASLSGYDSDRPRCGMSRSRSRIKTNPWLPSPQPSLSSGRREVSTLMESREEMALDEENNSAPVTDHRAICSSSIKTIPSSSDKLVSHNTRYREAGGKMSYSLPHPSRMITHAQFDAKGYGENFSNKSHEGVWWNQSRGGNHEVMNDLNIEKPKSRPSSFLSPNSEFVILAGNLEQLANNISFDYENALDNTLESASAALDDGETSMKDLLIDENSSSASKRKSKKTTAHDLGGNSNSNGYANSAYSPDSGVGGLAASDCDEQKAASVFGMYPFGLNMFDQQTGQVAMPFSSNTSHSLHSDIHPVSEMISSSIFSESDIDNTAYRSGNDDKENDDQICSPPLKQKVHMRRTKPASQHHTRKPAQSIESANSSGGQDMNNGTITSKSSQRHSSPVPGYRRPNHLMYTRSKSNPCDLKSESEFRPHTQYNITCHAQQSPQGQEFYDNLRGKEQFRGNPDIFSLPCQNAVNVLREFRTPNPRLECTPKSKDFAKTQAQLDSSDNEESEFACGKEIIFVDPEEPAAKMTDVCVQTDLNDDSMNMSDYDLLNQSFGNGDAEILENLTFDPAESTRKWLLTGSMQGSADTGYCSIARTSQIFSEEEVPSLTEVRKRDSDATLLGSSGTQNRNSDSLTLCDSKEIINLLDFSSSCRNSREIECGTNILNENFHGDTIDIETKEHIDRQLVQPHCSENRLSKQSAQGSDCNTGVKLSLDIQSQTDIQSQNSSISGSPCRRRSQNSDGSQNSSPKEKSRKDFHRKIKILNYDTSLCFDDQKEQYSSNTHESFCKTFPIAFKSSKSKQACAVRKQFCPIDKSKRQGPMIPMHEKYETFIFENIDETLSKPDYLEFLKDAPINDDTNSKRALFLVPGIGPIDMSCHEQLSSVLEPPEDYDNQLLAPTQHTQSTKHSGLISSSNHPDFEVISESPSKKPGNNATSIRVDDKHYSHSSHGEKKHNIHSDESRKERGLSSTAKASKESETSYQKGLSKPRRQIMSDSAVASWSLPCNLRPLHVASEDANNAREDHSHAKRNINNDDVRWSHNRPIMASSNQYFDSKTSHDQNSMTSCTHPSLDESTETIIEKVLSLQHEKDLIYEKIRAAQQERAALKQQEQSEHHSASRRRAKHHRHSHQHQLQHQHQHQHHHRKREPEQEDRKHVLLETLQDLKRQLEEQSVRLQDKESERS